MLQSLLSAMATRVRTTARVWTHRQDSSVAACQDMLEITVKKASSTFLDDIEFTNTTTVSVAAPGV